MTNQDPPVNPPCPADLIVSAGSHRPGALRDVLHAYADQLVAAGVFAALAPRDTCWLATIIAWEVVYGEESIGLRQRAAADDGWDNPLAVARALTIAASILDTW